MARLALSGQAAKARQLTAEAQREAELMRDVQLLLAHMLRQENVTLKFILDCLYDVGSVNLINQKVRSQPLNQLTKAIAVMSKPAFKVFALRWLYRNCPRLITNWLQRKVRFNAPDSRPSVTVSKVLEAEVKPTSAIDPAPTANAALTVNPTAPSDRDRQIQQLQHQVRWLTGILVAVVLLWGSSVVLPHYTTGSGLNQSLEKLQQP
jgi:hypothetical protein